MEPHDNPYRAESGLPSGERGDHPPAKMKPSRRWGRMALAAWGICVLSAWAAVLILQMIDEIYGSRTPDARWMAAFLLCAVVANGSGAVGIVAGIAWLRSRRRA